MSPSELSVGARARPVVVTAFFMAFAMGVYLLIANDGRVAWSTRTALDDAVALRPGWVWVYVSPYFLAPFLLLGTPPGLFRRVFARGAAVLVFTLPTFALLPTRIERPDLSALLTSPSVELLRAVYAFDTPARNAAPSGHVSLAMVLAWAAWHANDNRAWRAGVVSYAALVAWSILPTGQHHVLDFLSGAAVGAVVLGVFALRDRRGAAARATSSARP